ncbi:MAG: CbtB domain-containing protein [Nitrosopumilaceae archaeon]
MSTGKQITIASQKIPKIAAGLLFAIFAFGIFIVGFDQGHMFSIVIGDQAFEDLYLHELYHDMRHAAGYPCH